MNKINLKALGEEDFLSYKFNIPYYQRGYRWTPKQVNDLLNDIYEFQRKDEKASGEFYCLQPIVVLKNTKNSEYWDVIDGQQRLTTLFIILTYLKEVREMMYSSSPLYYIQYETREKDGVSSRLFLQSLNSIGQADRTNPDFFHMSQAYLTVKGWFEKNKINKGKFLDVLLDINFKSGIDIANNIRIIWYEVGQEEIENEEDGVIEIFNRLNKGKIPLTNAELVKALFFITAKDGDDKKRLQLEMGNEWDSMESVLQNKNFWYFITKETFRGSNHIEFIFNLVADKYVHLTNLEQYKNDKLFTFLVFNELISNQLISEKEMGSILNIKEFLWYEVKSCFRLLQDFYHDDEYYHLIGFLVHSSDKSSIAEILKLSQDKTKDEFKKDLKKKVEPFVSEDIDELNYEQNYLQIKDLLLLYNVLISQNSRYIRFPFDLYVDGEWTLEHIHAQNTADLNESQKRKLLEDQLLYFKNKDVQTLKEIQDLLNGDSINQEVFQMMQNKIFSQYSDNFSVHSLQNMALLNKIDNSVLNNNIFPIKCNYIKKLDEKGSFIPIGTKNVFMKYYSKNVEQNVSWDMSDQLAYLEDMKRIFKEFTKQKEKTKHHENEFLETNIG